MKLLQWERDTALAIKKGKCHLKCTIMPLHNPVTFLKAFPTRSTIHKNRWMYSIPFANGAENFKKCQRRLPVKHVTKDIALYRC